MVDPVEPPQERHLMRRDVPQIKAVIHRRHAAERDRDALVRQVAHQLVHALALGAAFNAAVLAEAIRGLLGGPGGR